MTGSIVDAASRVIVVTEFWKGNSVSFSLETSLDEEILWVNFNVPPRRVLISRGPFEWSIDKF